ncbi:MAG TPA: Rid family hydrolase [Gemmatimonadaceae bacterium]|nr:Rid family hydrolase [Gemmatimonadaceae bacterium]
MTARWRPITVGGDAPPPAGAYSPAIRAGDFLYVSGQVPRDPVTGETIGATVEEQTRQVVKNLEAVLAAGGAKLTDVIQCTVHLADPELWAAFNGTYRELMPKPYPTRTAVGASLRGFLVEITAVAYLGK